MGLPEINRADLSALRGHTRSTPGWEILSLILDEPEAAIARAHRLQASGSAFIRVADRINAAQPLKTGWSRARLWYT